MEAHARLSASGSNKWLNCPPSLTMEEQFEDRSSVYAEEGTLAHAVAELKARKYFTPMSKTKYTKEFNELKKHELWQSEMDGYTDFYLDYLKGVYLSTKNTPYVAIEKRVSYDQYACDGFGTADCIMIFDNTIYVNDLKYGKGVKVDADNNTQLMLYALGAYSEYSFLFKLEKAVVGIIQPRLDHVSTWEISIEDLLSFGEEVKEKSNLAIAGQGEIVAGDHCTFCKAKNICKEYLKDYIGLVPIMEKSPQANMLTNDEIGDILQKAIDLDKWAKGLKEYALTQSLKGENIPGWKAVPGRTSRVWTDMDLAFNTLMENGIAEAILYEKKPLTLAQTEKVIGKKEFEELAGSFVVKSEGKPTLVVETDKREAITNKVKAEDVFS